MLFYGDPAYPLSPFIQKAFSNAGITPLQQSFNTHMSSARQTVEWRFGEIVTLWAYVDYKKQQKIGVQAVGLHYKVAAFTNCRTIIRGGNKTSMFLMSIHHLWTFTSSSISTRHAIKSTLHLAGFPTLTFLVGFPA